MQRLEFRAELPQRRIYLVLAGVYVILGLLQFTVSAPGLGIFFLLLAGVFVFYYFKYAQFGLTLTPQGITMNGWQTHTYAWHEVAAVDGGKFWFADRVTLRLHDGTKRRAWAPMSAIGMVDAQFPLKVQGIQQWHAQFAGVAPQGPPAGQQGRPPIAPQHAFGQQFGQPQQAPQAQQPQYGQQPGQFGQPQQIPQGQYGQQPQYGQPGPQAPQQAPQPAGEWTQVFGVPGPDERR
ncbi:hypothetical protein GCM10022221_05730 [Actinocorallia aurea]